MRRVTPGNGRLSRFFPFPSLAAAEEPACVFLREPCCAASSRDDPIFPAGSGRAARYARVRGLCLARYGARRDADAQSPSTLAPCSRFADFPWCRRYPDDFVFLYAGQQLLAVALHVLAANDSVIA